MFILAFVAGYILYATISQRNRKKHALKQIIRIAKQNNGYITAATLLSETELDLEELQQLLQQLNAAGICEIEISPEGKPLYFFPDFHNQLLTKNKEGAE